MWITIKAVYDIETLQLIERIGYEYAGPLDLACSSGGKVAANDQALQDANVKAQTNLMADYGSSMANQSKILGNLQARMAYQSANPQGYTPTQLHAMTTSVNERTANAAKSAIGAAAAFAGQHGSSDVGGGGTGAMVGQIASQAAQAKAGELSQ